MLKQYFAFSPHTFVLGYKCYGFCLFKRQAMPTPGDTCSPLFAILNLLLFPLCAHMSLCFSSSLSFSSLILLPPHSLFPLSNKYSVLFCMMCSFHPPPAHTRPHGGTRLLSPWPLGNCTRWDLWEPAAVSVWYWLLPVGLAAPSACCLLPHGPLGTCQHF